MLVSQFNALLQQRLVKSEAVLGSKAGEYASKTDRLHNFKVAARIAGCSPEKALWMMLLKHIVSVQDMVEASDQFAAHHSPEMIDEKLGDIINYMILLEGLMKERLRDQEIEVPPAIARTAARMAAAPTEGSAEPRRPRKKAAKKKSTRKKGSRKKRS